MKRFIFSVTSMLILIAITSWYFLTPREQKIESVHYHAGFRVYLDNELQDFSNYQYMNFTPCLEHNQKKSAEEEQIEKAHLHDSVGDVVHVHRPGATWGDLFSNMGVEIPNDMEIIAYIDGEERADFLSDAIEPYTTLIVSIGEADSSRSGERVDRVHIDEIEAKSELCGS